MDPDQLDLTVYKRVDIWLVSSSFPKSKLLNKLICSFGQVKFSMDKYIMAIYLSLDK